MGLTNTAPFTFTKRGVFYFSRRVPSDLQGHYRRDRITLSLKTKSSSSAATKANSLAARLDEEWLTLRWRSGGDPLERFRRTQPVSLERSSAPLLSEAKSFYLDAKGPTRPKTFRQAVERAVGLLTKLHGDRPVDQYAREDANAFRDALLAQGLQPVSAKRTISTIQALLNFTTREHGLPDVTAFSSLYFGEEDEKQSKRKPIPVDVIRSVQSECRRLDDEGRWLVALISDTGMRLAEAAGLVREDVVLDGEYPHVIVRPHPWRRIKTRASERTVPLVGEALWAAKRAFEEAPGRFLFPKYTSEAGCKANSASAALNKWLKPRLPEGCVVHSFRHSFRDRLRAVECPKPIMDRLGGWTLEGIGEGYGDGYDMPVLNRWVYRAI